MLRKQVAKYFATLADLRHISGVILPNPPNPFDFAANFLYECALWVTLNPKP